MALSDDEPECLTPTLRGSGALLMCGYFPGMVWVHLSCLEEGSLQITTVVLSDNLYPVRKYVYPGGTGLF